MLGLAQEGKPDKPADKPEKEQKGEPAAPPPADEQKPAPTEPTPDTPRKRSRAKSIDTESLVSATAKAVGGAVVQAIQATPPVAKPDTQAAELPAELQDNLQIYRELHRIDPKKYPADLPTRLAKFARDEVEYADRWEAQHQGETYDSDAEEHENWYASHQPQVDPTDFTYAKTILGVREDLQRQYEPKIRELEGQLRQFKIEPEIQRAATAAALPVLQAIDPEAKDLSKETLQTFQKKDPLGWQVAQQVDAAFGNVIVAAGKLWHGLAAFDEKNAAHGLARQAFNEVQEMVKQLPASQQTAADGRKFLPLAEFYNLPQDAQKHFFTLSYDDIVYYIANRMAPATASDLYKKQKAEVERMAGMLGYVRQDQPPGTQQKGEAKNGASEQHVSSQSAPPIVQSPSVGAGTPQPPNSVGGVPKPENYNDFFFSRLLGR